MASTSIDAEVAIKGVMDLMQASAPLVAALGSVQKIQRDDAPIGVALPTMTVYDSGFSVGTRPQRQGGTSIQIWSIGTVTVQISSGPLYSASLARLLMDALDNVAEYTVAGLGVIRWIRYTDTVAEPVVDGNRTWRLRRVNFQVAAKAN